MNILEILNTTHEIGKSLKIKFSDSTLDYTVNGKPPRELPIDYFLVLKNKYDSKLHVQLKHKPTQALFDRLLKEIQQYIHVNRKERKEKVSGYDYIKLTDRATDANSASYDELLAVYDAQYSVLDSMQRELLIYAELKDFIIDADFTFKNEVLTLDTTGLINFGSSGKATFKMSKKDALMLLYALEKTNLLEFESELQRNKFIQQNFCYTEMRNNAANGDALQMKDVNSEMSNLHSPDRNQKLSNDKAFKKLTKQLDDTIMSFKFANQPKR